MEILLLVLVVLVVGYVVVCVIDKMCKCDVEEERKWILDQVEFEVGNVVCDVKYVVKEVLLNVCIEVEKEFNLICDELWDQLYV